MGNVGDTIYNVCMMLKEEYNYNDICMLYGIGASEVDYIRSRYYGLITGDCQF